MPRFKRGVTLVELLIVVAIVSILAAAVMVAINPAKRMGQARDSTRKANLSVVSRALLAYYLDRQTYPDPAVVNPSQKFSESTAGDNWIPGFRPDYLKILPKDPKQASLVSGLASTIGQGRVAAVSMKAFPEGVIRVNGFGNRVNLESNFFQNNSWVGGFAGIENWSDLEPNDGQYDFSYLKALRTRACTDHKPVVFIVKTGGGATSAVPNWIKLPPYNVPIVNVINAHGVLEPNLVPWDSKVRQKWLEASAAIANEFDDPAHTPDECNQYVAGIYVTGTQAQWPEMIFPKDPIWLDPIAMAPNPIFDVPNGTVYSNAWKAALFGMAAQFQKTWLINMVDTVPDPNGPGRLNGPLDAIVAEISTNYSGRATVGTANAGYTSHDVIVNGSDYKYQTVRASNPALTNVKIVYEIGPKKQDETVTDDLYKALEDCKQKLGCTAAFVHGNTWAQPTNPDEAKRAVADFWAPEFIPPALTCSPSSSSVAKDESVTLTASGGTIPYSWSATGGKPFETGTDPTFSVSFSAEGPHDVKVTDGVGSTTCVVTVTASGGGGGGGASDFKYRYFSDGLQTFELWAILEDKDDKEAYPNPARTCKKPQPLDNLNYNYCVAY